MKTNSLFHLMSNLVNVERRSNSTSVTRSFSLRHVLLLFALLTIGIGNVWGAGTALSDLNFDAPSSLPSNYTYSSTNSPAIPSSQQGPSGDKRNCILIGNGGGSTVPSWSSGAPTEATGKRWMAFQPAEDCDVNILVYGKSKTFYLLDKDKSSTSQCLSSEVPDADEWQTWNVTGLKADTWYVIAASSSSTYVGSIQFISASAKYAINYELDGGVYGFYHPSVGATDMPFAV